MKSGPCLAQRERTCAEVLNGWRVGEDAVLVGEEEEEERGGMDREEGRVKRELRDEVCLC